jgi:hypothetical protein
MSTGNIFYMLQNKDNTIGIMLNLQVTCIHSRTFVIK